MPSSAMDYRVCTAQSMNYKEYRLLEQRINVLNRNNFSISKFLEKTKENGILSRAKVDQLNLLLEEVKEIDLERLKVFLFEISRCMRFSEFVSILEMMVDFVTLADGLRRIHIRPRTIQCVYNMTTQMDDSPLLFDYFTSLKIKVDNKMVPNLHRHFEDLKFRVFLHLTPCQNKTLTNQLANRLAVATWLQTQLYRDEDDRKRILNDFRVKLKGKAITDTSFIDTIYYSKMACTDAISGQFDLAAENMIKAEYHAGLCRWPFARMAVYHDRQFISRKRNVEHKDVDNVREIFRNCELALDSLTDIKGGSQVFLKRIFMLNMVQALLGIGTFLEIDTKEVVINTDVKRAGEFLEEVEHLSAGHQMENRRKMLFLLCKGRFAELKHLENEAIGYIEESKQLSETGAILSELEKKNIEAYLKNIDT